MTFRSILMAAALLGGAGNLANAEVKPMMGTSPEATQETRAAIQKVIAAEDAAWKAGDAAAFCEAALPDVTFTNVVGMFSVGHAPMRAQHERIFATNYRGSTLAQVIVNLKLVRPDVAIVDTVAHVTGFKALPPGAEAVGGVLSTRLEQVMVMEAGRWRVASFHNVPVNPAAAAGGPPR